MAKLPTLHLPLSWGEIVDRMTILEIKRERLATPQALANVAKELALLAEAAEPHLAGNAEIAALKAQLRAVNDSLWEVEDSIRGKDAKDEFDEEFVCLARSVYRLNDERGAIKRRINAVSGSEIVEEKSYTPYRG